MQDIDPNKEKAKAILTYSLQLNNNEDLDNLITNINMNPKDLIAVAKIAAVFHNNNPGEKIKDYIHNGTSNGASLVIIDEYCLDGLFIKYNLNKKKKISEESINYLNTMILTFIDKHNGICCASNTSSSHSSISQALF